MLKKNQSNEERDVFIATKISQQDSLQYNVKEEGDIEDKRSNIVVSFFATKESSSSISSLPEEMPKSKSSKVDAKAIFKRVPFLSHL